MSLAHHINLQLTLAFLLQCSTAFSQVTFQKVYGGAGKSDYLRSVQQTSDGGYIAAGYTDSWGAGSWDVFLMKIDVNGDMLWSKTFGGSALDWARSVRQTVDGGYIITGKTKSFGAGNDDVFLIKTDGSGNLLWTKTFGGPEDDAGASVQQTNDGGYIVAGYTSSFGAGDRDVYLIKTNGSGNLLWTKTFGGSAIDRAYSVQQTVDGGYIIAGETKSFGAGGNCFGNPCSDFYLIKTDGSGNLLWTKTFGGTGQDLGFSVQQTTDGGYIIAGDTESFGAGGFDVYLIKTDESGNLLWTKTYGGTGSDIGISVQQTTDGGYIATGYTWGFGAGGRDAYLIKTDSIGNLLWSKMYGGSLAEYQYAVIQCNDGGYITAGATHSWAAGSYGGVDDEFYIIKTDSLGNSGCNEVDPPTVVGSGGVVDSGGVVGTGGVEGSGGSETTVVLDTLTLCFKVGSKNSFFVFDSEKISITL